jgi:hypothetical protein
VTPDIGTNEIMRQTGKSKTCVWCWQERFAQEGYDGLLRDKTRRSGIPPLGAAVAERVFALTLTDPPAAATHWTPWRQRPALASGRCNASGAVTACSRTGCASPSCRTIRSSPKFKDIVGLYFDPPAHAIVLSLDEKSRRRGTGLVTTGRFLGEGMKSAAVSGTRFLEGRKFDNEFKTLHGRCFGIPRVRILLAPPAHNILI